jgi:hypothetical protein
MREVYVVEAQSFFIDEQNNPYDSSVIDETYGFFTNIKKARAVVREEARLTEERWERYRESKLRDYRNRKANGEVVVYDMLDWLDWAVESGAKLYFVKALAKSTTRV